MRFLTRSVFLLILSVAPAFAMQQLNGWCSVGGNPISVMGYSSTNLAQTSYPGCTVTIYITGSGGMLATLYSNNTGTPLSNPFTANTSTGAWAFYAANGVYDVQISGGTPALPSPVTFGANSLFDVASYTPPTQVCGTAGEVQYSGGTAFACDSNLIWNSSSHNLQITQSLSQNAINIVAPVGGEGTIGVQRSGLPGLLWQYGVDSSGALFFFDAAGGKDVIYAAPGSNTNFSPSSGTAYFDGNPGVPVIVAANGSFIQSSGGFLSSANNWQAFQSLTDGALLSGYGVVQNRSTNMNGGYIDFAPVTYNPYDSGSPCIDANGNTVQQPVPLNDLANFGGNDALLWVGTSPQMPASGSCGTPLTVNENYGLNTNVYVFARGGLATDNARYNAINTIYLGGGNPSGGIEAGALIGGTLYPTGTVTNCCGTLATPTYLGGYVQVGHSASAPSAGTIATVNNPLVAGDGIVQGTLYYDDTSNCLKVANLALAFNCLGTGGSGGTPGGVNTNVQFNNSGAFGGSNNFEWNNTNQLLTIVGKTATAAIAVSTAFVQADQGFLATAACTTITCIQAPGGGVQAMAASFGGTGGAGGYVQMGNGTTDPTGITGDTLHAGAEYYNTGTLCSGSPGLRVYNGASWGCIGSGSGSPGGMTNYIQFNSSGTFGGVSQLQWCATVAGACTATGLMLVTAASSSVAGLAVKTGFAQADEGFLAPASTCTVITCFNSLGGGMNALAFAAVNYVQSGNYTGAAPTLVGADTFHAGAMAWSLTNSCETVFNGSTWNCIAGGSGGSAAGPLNAVQFNNPLGTFAGSANFTWNNTTQLLTLTGISSTAGIAVANAYMQADGGFFGSTLCTNWNCFNAPSGGYGGKSFTAANYIQSGNATATPPLTNGDSYHAGALFYNLTAGCEQLYNGSTWNCLTSGAVGVTSLNAFTGSVTIQGTTNEISVASAGNIITLSTPQPLAVTSNVAFNSINAGCGAAGPTQYVFQSCATGSNISFQTSNSTFSVDGQGDVSAALQFNVGSGGVYKVNGAVVITAAGTFSGAGGVSTSGSVTALSGFFSGNVETLLGGGIFISNGQNGVTCSGLPTASFASVGGIVTHC